MPGLRAAPHRLYDGGECGWLPLLQLKSGILTYENVLFDHYRCNGFAFGPLGLRSINSLENCRGKLLSHVNRAGASGDDEELACSALLLNMVGVYPLCHSRGTPGHAWGIYISVCYQSADFVIYLF
jgi:hypothetical protein